jgi:hypothetical protein
MSNDTKTLCKYKKEKIEEQMESLKNIVRNPKFICKKCARAAGNAECLCKPVPLD